MDKLQQQIKEFHKRLIPALKKVLEEYDKSPTPQKYNTVVKPCKQLIQKCSYKSASDIRSLRDLTYQYRHFLEKGQMQHLPEPLRFIPQP